MSTSAVATPPSSFRSYIVFIVLALAFCCVSVASLLRFRLLPGIDFAGGSILDVTVPTGASLNVSKLKKDIEPITIDTYESRAEGVFEFRFSTVTLEQKEAVLSAIHAQAPEAKEVNFASIGPVLGQELIVKAGVSFGIVVAAIFIYVWLRFSSFLFGLSAVLATMHDGLIVLGVFSLLGRLWGVEVDALFVTAMVTILSFSIHDTVVIFDHIRERKREYKGESFEESVRGAVDDTIVRSLRNSIGILIILLTLFLLGGESIRWFIGALFIGTIVGTYSSTFVAMPLLLLFTRFSQRIQVKTRIKRIK